MEWFPIVFITFKVLVLGSGMFFAVKWHYEQGKKGKETQWRSVIRAGGMVAAVFALSLLGLLLATFAFARWLGLDLS